MKYELVECDDVLSKTDLFAFLSLKNVLLDFLQNGNKMLNPLSEISKRIKQIQRQKLKQRQRQRQNKPRQDQARQDMIKQSKTRQDKTR